jgi:hypothetical protein
MRRLPIVLAGVFFLAALGCSRPPQGTIEEAGRVIETAKAAGAALYAPESLAAAERAFAALNAELSVQEKKGRLSRSYVQAESLGLEALIAGERAAAEAERGKDLSKGDALSLVGRVTADLQEVEKMVARAVGKNRSAKIADLDAGLREAGALLARARGELDDGRFADSLQHARSAEEKVDAVRSELRKTVPRPPKPGRRK